MLEVPDYFLCLMLFGVQYSMFIHVVVNDIGLIIATTKQTSICDSSALNTPALQLLTYWLEVFASNPQSEQISVHRILVKYKPAVKSIFSLKNTTII